MFQTIKNINGYPTVILTKEIAKNFQKQITSIWNLIPGSQHGIDDILKEEKGDKKYLGKWKHSFIVLNKKHDEVIAFVVGYERISENNSQYPVNSIHLKSISVKKIYQSKGIGKELLRLWLQYNKDIGYQFLSGDLKFSAQTNSEQWNSYVQKFYESLGFNKTASKKYPKKVDNIYFLQ